MSMSLWTAQTNCWAGRVNTLSNTEISDLPRKVKLRLCPQPGLSFPVDPDELIVGTLPPFSVGQGKEFVRYLTKQEELLRMFDYLNELSPMGHIVPDHERVVRRGMRAIIADCASRQRKAK